LPPLTKAFNYSSVDKSADYREFRELFLKENCVKCRLCECRTQLVLDRGNPQAKIFIIGEAPGAQEDLQGKSFVGRSGKLLDKVMASVGLDTNADTYITNVVKCRPPENRAPFDDEAQTCAPYLDKQLRLMKPEVLVLLGATAYKRMAPERKNFKGDVGTFFDYAGPEGTIRCLSLFHPSYLLYNSKIKGEMFKHVIKLRQFLEEKGIKLKPAPVLEEGKLPF
jgi:uracil-DNA glycosylase